MCTYVVVFDSAYGSKTSWPVHDVSSNFFHFFSQHNRLDSYFSPQQSCIFIHKLYTTELTAYQGHNEKDKKKLKEFVNYFIKHT